MSTTLVRLALLLLVATTVTATAGRLAGSGRLVEWIPFNEDELTVSAAVGRSVNPIVLYNPERLELLAPQLIQFVIRRQDFAAYLAADLLRGHRQFSKPWGTLDFPDGSSNKSLPFSPIREEQVYSHQALQHTNERGLDCLAYQSLEPRERLALREVIRGERRAGSLQIFPSARQINIKDLAFYDSDACIAIFRSVRQ
jgi:hypothetical protein